MLAILWISNTCNCHTHLYENDNCNWSYQINNLGAVKNSSSLRAFIGFQKTLNYGHRSLQGEKKNMKKTHLSVASGPSPAQPDWEPPRTHRVTLSSSQAFLIKGMSLCSRVPVVLEIPVNSAPGHQTSTAVAQAPIPQYYSFQTSSLFLCCVPLLWEPAQGLCYWPALLLSAGFWMMFSCRRGLD